MLLSQRALKKHPCQKTGLRRKKKSYKWFSKLENSYKINKNFVKDTGIFSLGL